MLTRKKRVLPSYKLYRTRHLLEEGEILPATEDSIGYCSALTAKRVMSMNTVKMHRSLPDVCCDIGAFYAISRAIFNIGA